ncbi:bifunctional phosphopantothenoylcysteine decarboxylase/phosphopantothenate--cysteine ligase CoaBC [Desulfobulbus rhabdoformis]|uniref:bifunctional phosphopantothenoylcysteine decarboxylase/phosphopantothenate--cysteine ligase CoaBC n=1 Tax=Desulfobulbus rhabdoformis TaxID=34032 RepID=UPI0019639DF1|nr:bifunctional phosphopantothenoylcysteine decarboxylase/phosphopantothenate--cysteine ligase CoaBC [Desulfobulbus rhabdoformis]MBM9615403.1 bifunctional phosphopantothenoylcysteine decarboxylase/phosphopantothenate--cysteine ligase CoaBC [Desulfobulbus rhabdoformis]
MSGLQGKRILFGITGSIAAYKAAFWVRELVKEEALVNIIMTSGAEEFISPLTFTALCGNPVHLDMFASDPDGVMAHINLSRDADLLLIAPATAQTMAKLATGMADNLLATAVLAAKIPVVICPAMNTAMYTHQASQDNRARLLELGYHLVAPGCGDLACGETGDGRLCEWEDAREAMLQVLTPQDLAGRKVLITAGPTREALDPVRYLSNRSSGKMGYAVARAARRRGAEVTLVSGPVSLSPPSGVELVSVTSAQDMADAVLSRAEQMDVIVKSAAVADFKPDNCASLKIKKGSGGLRLDLVKNIDILASLGQKKKKGQLLIGFAAESHNHLDEGQRKLTQKNLDMIVVNDILGAQTGFDVETNQVTLITPSQHQQLPLLSKTETAHRIWDAVVALDKGM